MFDCRADGPGSIPGREIVIKILFLMCVQLYAYVRVGKYFSGSNIPSIFSNILLYLCGTGFLIAWYAIVHDLVIPISLHNSV